MGQNSALPQRDDVSNGRGVGWWATGWHYLQSFVDLAFCEFDCGLVARDRPSKFLARFLSLDSSLHLQLATATPDAQSRPSSVREGALPEQICTANREATGFGQPDTCLREYRRFLP